MKSYYKDIARQLVEEKPGRDMNVIFGGGRDFLGASIKQADKVKFGGSAEKSCNRTDGQNLVEKYLSQFDNTTNVKYVKTSGELMDVDFEEVDRVLGLFANNHMNYNSLRDRSSDGEPSLAEMTKAAIRILNNKKNKKGFVLMVEGGKIDQAHHQNHARLALEEMVEFDRAIKEAIEMTSDDTLIVVTADHAHSMIFNGYPRRGNDILGILTKPEVPSYETILYATGPGFWKHITSNDTNSSFIAMENFSAEQRASPTYMHTSLIPMNDAVHSGEDVGVFATGPGSRLIQGAFEQNYIPYVISFSACIGPLSHQNPSCRHEKLTNESNKVTTSFLILITLNCICFSYRHVLL